MSSFSSKICFLLYSFDFLSGSENLRRFNRRKNVSLVGLILTIILIMMMAIYATTKLVDYFQQVNFSLNAIEDSSLRTDATLYIGNETIALLRVIQHDIDENEVDIPDLLKIFKFNIRQYEYDCENDKYEIKYYPLVNCTKYFTAEDLVKYDLPVHYVQQSLCPPYDEGLKIRWNKKATASLIFQVFLCNKNEDSNCYSEEEIQEKYNSGELDGISFGFIHEFDLIDNYNRSNPLSVESVISEAYIDFVSHCYADVKSKFIYYESNNGIIFNNFKKYTGLTSDSFTHSSKAKELFDYKSTILSLSFSLNINSILNYKRTYEKITSVIVDIFGITRVLFFLGGFIVSVLSQNYFSFKLFDEIFSQKFCSKNSNEINKNIQNFTDPKNSPNKNISKENKISINISNTPEDSNKIGSDKIILKTKKHKTKKGKIKKNNIINTIKIINEGNSDNSNMKIMENSIIKKIDDEKYSAILLRYLGYDANDKRKFSFWYYICSQFNRRNNNMKIINSCAKLINQCLSLEQLIKNCLNIDILLTPYEYQELNNIDIFNKIIDDDFKKTIKDIKLKKE